jgi:hypothetical protein
MRRLIESEGAGVDEFGLNAGDAARVDVLDESAGKAVFHAKQNADFFHLASSVMNRW